MSHTFSRGRRTRRNFGRIATVAPMPNLIEVQKNSYEQFLDGESAGRGPP